MPKNNFQNARNSKLIGVMIVLLLTVAALAIGGYRWWLDSDNTQKNVQHAPAAPTFMPLESFTVNLVNPDNNPNRILYIGLTLRLPDKKTHQQLDDYLPEIRSRLLLLFSRQTVENLANEQGKQQLVEQIKKTLSAPLVAGQPSPVISDVLFTAFILR